MNIYCLFICYTFSVGNLFLSLGIDHQRSKHLERRGPPRGQSRSRGAAGLVEHAGSVSASVKRTGNRFSGSSGARRAVVELEGEGAAGA